MHKDWVPSADEFGGFTFIYGTLVTGFGSVILATILGVSIGLFLSLMAPRRVAAVIGPLVEMLAAIPSVVIGLIGIYLICPFIKSDIEPWLHSVFGWIPIFGEPGTGRQLALRGDPRADDHGRPDHRGAHARPVPDRPGRTARRRRGARRDSLGDDPRRRAADDALRDHRRLRARLRPRDR